MRRCSLKPFWTVGETPRGYGSGWDRVDGTWCDQKRRSNRGAASQERRPTMRRVTGSFNRAHGFFPPCAGGEGAVSWRALMNYKISTRAAALTPSLTLAIAARAKQMSA